MLPLSLIVGRITTDGSDRKQSENDAMAAVLFALIDQRRDRTWADGYRAAAKELGWQERTVATVADRLIAAGLITVESDGHTSTVLRITHNPARGADFVNPVVDLPRRNARAGHQRRASMAERRAGNESLSRSTRTDERVPREQPLASHAPDVAFDATGAGAASAPMRKASGPAPGRARDERPSTNERRHCLSCAGSLLPGAANPCGSAFPEDPEATFCEDPNGIRPLVRAFPGSIIVEAV